MGVISILDMPQVQLNAHFSNLWLILVVYQHNGVLL